MIVGIVCMKLLLNGLMIRRVILWKSMQLNREMTIVVSTYYSVPCGGHRREVPCTVADWLFSLNQLGMQAYPTGSRDPHALSSTLASLAINCFRPLGTNLSSTNCSLREHTIAAGVGAGCPGPSGL